MSCTDPPHFQPLHDRIKPDTLVKVGQGVPRFVVGYWATKGLGAPIRMMLSASGVCHWVALYDVLDEGQDEWTKHSWLEDKGWMKPECNPFMNLPYLIDVQEQQVLVQTNAILAYVGQELHMMGSTKLQMAKCQELLCEIYDVRNVMVEFAYSSLNPPSAAKCVSRADAHFQKLEAHLMRNGTSFLVGVTLSAPDFHLYEMLDQYDTLTRQHKLADLWDSYPQLASFKRSMETLVENHCYLESFLHKGLPFNNPYAQFGSDPSGSAFQRGQAAPWRQRGIVDIDSRKKRGIDEISTVE
jgi:glutathione S-transferase